MFFFRNNSLHYYIVIFVVSAVQCIRGLADRGPPVVHPHVETTSYKQLPPPFFCLDRLEFRPIYLGIWQRGRKAYVLLICVCFFIHMASVDEGGVSTDKEGTKKGFICIQVDVATKSGDFTSSLCTAHIYSPRLPILC